MQTPRAAFHVSWTGTQLSQHLLPRMLLFKKKKQDSSFTDNNRIIKWVGPCRSSSIPAFWNVSMFRSDLNSTVSSFGSKVWQRQNPWKLRANPSHSFLILAIKPRLHSSSVTDNLVSQRDVKRKKLRHSRGEGWGRPLTIFTAEMGL